ncbi:MAG: hypothetical protein CM1200mP41_32620 [Gammaproteobacteria bacterium]|nr:MAG: hypothetical protein CM1200mP41_32620 [Gammaproteobacteria bacterium]
MAEQIQAHLDEGLDRLVFMPYRYQDDQVEAIAPQTVSRCSPDKPGPDESTPLDRNACAKHTKYPIPRV